MSCTNYLFPETLQNEMAIISKDGSGTTEVDNSIDPGQLEATPIFSIKGQKHREAPVDEKSTRNLAPSIG